MEEKKILLEFLDIDSYNFYKNFNVLKDTIYNIYSMNNTQYKDRVVIINQNIVNKRAHFFIENQFELIELGDNRYIFHSSILHISYFISFNSVKMVNYCLRLISEKFHSRFRIVLHQIFLILTKKSEKIVSQDDIINKNKKRIKREDFLDNFEIKNLSESDYYYGYLGFLSGKKNEEYNNILNSNKIMLLGNDYSAKSYNFYSLYYINKPIIDLNLKISGKIFQQMEYFYILVLLNFKKLIKNHTDDVIASKTALIIQQEISDLTKNIERQSLDIRKSIIDDVLKKYQRV